MSDLVERLRNYRIGCGIHCSDYNAREPLDECVEAADEIERLTNALKRIEACRLLESDTHRAIARKTLKESNRT